MSRAATRPPTISRTDGRTRRWTCASSQTAATSRTTSLVALGIARRTSSIVEPVDERRGSTDRAPRMRTPWSCRPSFRGSSSTTPTGWRPIVGWVRMSFRTIAPASPAPIRRIRDGLRSSPCRVRRRNPKSRLWKRISSERHDGQSAPEHHGGQGEWTRAGEQEQPAADRDQEERCGARQREPTRFLDARVSPHLSVETERVVREEVQRGHDRDEDPEVVPVEVRDAPLEAQRERTEVRGEDECQVEQCQWHVAAQPSNDARSEISIDRPRSGTTSTSVSTDM